MKNTTTIKTTSSLEKTIRKHIDDLMVIACEDADAAVAILNVVTKYEEGLDIAKKAKRQACREAGFGR